MARKQVFFVWNTTCIANSKRTTMVNFLLWMILLVLCWPLALLAIILYPIVWLILLPFRLLGFAIDLSFSFVKNLLMLPFTVLQRR
jgi:hypothetical protein